MNQPDRLLLGMFGGLALMAVAGVASYLAARWAARFEPIRALRAE